MVAAIEARLDELVARVGDDLGPTELQSFDGLEFTLELRPI